MGSPPHHGSTEWLIQRWGVCIRCGGTPGGDSCTFGVPHVPGDLVCFDGVQGVEAVLSRWIIQDESVRVEVGDNGDQGDTPKIRAWATPSFEYRFRRDCDFGGFCVIEIYLIFVIDGCVARVGKFACAEE